MNQETIMQALELVNRFAELGAFAMKASVGMLIDTACAMDGTDPVEFARDLVELVERVNDIEGPYALEEVEA